MPAEKVTFKVAGPGGVLVDRSVNPNRVYIYDGMNSRILGFSSLGVCSGDPQKACTSDSDCSTSSCQLQVAGVNSQKTADIVIGQPNFASSACNGDGTFLSYPIPASASAQYLCSQPQGALSPTEGGAFASMAVDEGANLYVSDFFNNRVIRYNSPFTTDTIADDVWGQDDFLGRLCNKGRAQPDATTLCLEHVTPTRPSTPAVEIDSSGNLWISDSGNNRILRFSKDPTSGTISKTADLVLGQADFSTRGSGAGFNQLFTPSGLRVDGAGMVFVADSDNNRVLIYDPPYSNGQTARPFAANFRKPTGIEFDVVTADPTSGGIWVSDTNNYQLVLFDLSGNPKKTLFKDTYRPDGACGNPGMSCPSPLGFDTCNMCDARGSIGITIDGDVIVAASNGIQNAHYYKHPIPTLNPGNPYPASASLFAPPFGHNYLSSKGFLSPRSIVLGANQLVVADAARIMFWNIPNGITDLTNGKAADGVVGVIDFDKQDPWGFWGVAASNGKLWVTRKATVETYSLPLTHGAVPPATNPNDPNERQTVISFKNPLPVLGGGQLSWGFNDNLDDLTVSYDGRFLWLVQPGKQRIFRIRDPLSAPVVDVILGQKTVDGSSCNQGDPNFAHDKVTWAQDKPLDYLCYPGAIAFDRYGNLFVSDHFLEISGNMRFLIFKKDDHPFLNNPDSLTSAVFAPAASKAITQLSPWKPAFDSQNQMVVGFNGYGLGGRFPGVFSDPTVQSAPDKYIKDYYSHAVAAAFDSNDNLYLADLNWGRVLAYRQPFVSPPTPTSILTPTPSPSPTPMLSLTPTPIVTAPPPTVTPTRTTTPTSSVTTLTLLPVADSYVRKDNANKNFGTRNTSLIDGASPVAISFLKFDLTTLANKTIQSAKLRLKITNDPSPHTQYVKSVANTSWGETTITYNNRPTVGSTIATFTSNLPNTFVEINITSEASAKKGGLMSLGIDETSSNRTAFFTKENVTDKPQLVIVYN